MGAAAASFRGRAAGPGAEERGGPEGGRDLPVAAGNGSAAVPASALRPRGCSRASAPSRAVRPGGAAGERGGARTLAFPLGWGRWAFNRPLGWGLRSCVCALLSVLLCGSKPGSGVQAESFPSQRDAWLLAAEPSLQSGDSLHRDERLENLKDGTSDGA